MFPSHSGEYQLPESGGPFDDPHEWLALVLGAIDETLALTSAWDESDAEEALTFIPDLRYLLLLAMQCYAPIEEIVKFFIVRHKENQNTNGGSTIADTYNKHSLNDEVYDADSLVSLSSGDAIIVEGTYLLLGVASCYRPNAFHAAIYDVSASARTFKGVSGYSDSAVAVTPQAHVFGMFTITGTKTVRLEVWTQTAAGGNGLGVPSNKSPDETYGYLIGLKVA